MFFGPKNHPVISHKDILSWIFDEPTYDVDKPVYFDPSNSSRYISHNQAKTLIRKLVAGFKKAGLEKGDCVNLHSYNDIYYPILFLAIIASGGVFAGSNPSYKAFELSHHMKIAKVKFIISEPQIVGPVLTAAQQNGIPMSNIWIFNEFDPSLPSNMKSWRSLLDHGEENWVRFDDLQTAKNTPAARFFSSGTTGLPKAASLSHYNLVAQHTLVYGTHSRGYEPTRLMSLPNFHIAAAPPTHITALKDGTTTYIMRRFNLEKFIHHIQIHAITDIYLVPPIAIAIINSPMVQQSCFSTIRSATCGAAPLDKSQQSMLRNKLPAGVPCTQTYGLTEISGAGTTLPYPEDDETGSIGRLLPGLEAKLVDDKGREIREYEIPGELCFRGPTVMNGYFDNPAANKEAFDQDGWFKTGDLAYCAKETECWYIVGRKKELIKVRGFQVAPKEIEGVLLSHPAVMDVAVIGVKLTNQDDEHPRAYIVKRDGVSSSSLTENDVKVFAASRLAKYKALTGGVRFVDALPRNATGKTLRIALRERAETEGGQKAHL
ncbi:AMP-binding enzyme [Penicillium coprophilum]|uniref:AMP-binding enzyme n=1 Tax=Penicillium coprophilum TaxID=36646 RepID=UPI002395DC27|nr:AMP-binding enzyme [Penicillium coprophilum]KAJ5162644.1 AMP-binding enzyme [Penicillium coprophilum]